MSENDLSFTQDSILEAVKLALEDINKYFTNILSDFIKDPKTEKIETKYRKGRNNERDVVAFINRNDKRFVIFDRDSKKFITGWRMNDLQYQEFINNNNII